MRLILENSAKNKKSDVEFCSNQQINILKKLFILTKKNPRTVKILHTFTEHIFVKTPHIGSSGGFLKERYRLVKRAWLRGETQRYTTAPSSAGFLRPFFMGDRNDSKKKKNGNFGGEIFESAALWDPKHGNSSLQKLRISVGSCFPLRPTEIRLNSVGGSTGLLRHRND